MTAGVSGRKRIAYNQKGRAKRKVSAKKMHEQSAKNKAYEKRLAEK